MRTFQVLLFFIGLSLDGFVLMMNKGATVRNLSVRRGLLYALIFACIGAAAVALGYVFSLLFVGDMGQKLRVELGCLLLFAIGMYMIMHAWHYRRQEERLDKDFGVRQCVHLALFSSIDLLFLAVAFSLFSISFVKGVCMAFVVSFVTIVVALYIGYTRGSAYTRVVGMSGGALMICLALYLQAVYVFLK